MTLATFGETTRQWIPLSAQLLNWPPSVFWSSTPVELASALSSPAATGSTHSPSRELIEQLMERDAHG